MPSAPRTQHLVLCARCARRDVKLRASSWGHAKPLIHVCDRLAGIMIGIDATRSGGAERIGAGHHGHGNGFGGARHPPAPRADPMPTACRREINGFLPTPRVAQSVEETSSEAPFLLSAGVWRCVGDMARSRALFLK